MDILRVLKKASLLGQSPVGSGAIGEGFARRRAKRFGMGLLLLLFAACSKGYFTHEAAREAAVEYYSKLIRGDYMGFVNGYAGAEEMPEDFRSQLRDATAQFMADNMRSLCNVTALSDSLFADSTAIVMLQLQFSDSTTEEIELSLILQEEEWRMK